MIWILAIGGLALIVGFGALFGAPYVPSHRRDIERLFDDIKLGSKDLLVDIGAGDGRVLRSAARRGSRAIGYEINPIFALISRLSSAPKIQVKWANFWRSELPVGTTVVYAFSVNKDRRKLEKHLEREVARLKNPLVLACYGSPLKTRKPMRVVGGYTLYQFKPALQPEKAQV